MKKNSIAFTLALALAALAAPFAQTFAAGDIASIAAVDDPAHGIMYPNVGSPLVAGEELYVRILMANKDWQNGAGKWSWSSDSFTDDTGPALGLAIGSRVVFAPYSSVGPTVETFDEGYFTPLYFKYKVQPGDVGLPVAVLRTDRVADENSALPYLIKNVNYGLPSYSLVNDYNGEAASFTYVESGAMYWIAQNTGVELQYTLKYLQPCSSDESGVMIQSISFDESKYADSWRHVYATISGPVDG